MPVSPCISEGCQRAKLESDLAAAQTLAEERRLRIEKLCGMLTAKDSDLAAAKFDFERQVDKSIEWMKAYEKSQADLAAAQESLALEKSFVHALNGLHAGDIETLKGERDEARAEAAAAETRVHERWADALSKNASMHVVLAVTRELNAQGAA